MERELVLWGLPKNESDPLCQVILSSQCKSQADVDKIIAAASKDGFHSFRVQELDLSTPPDFVGAISSAIMEK